MNNVYWLIHSIDSACTTVSKPTFVRQPPSLVVVYISNNVTLSVQGFGGTLTYQWFKNDLQITESNRYKGTTTSKLTIVGVHWGDEGLYSCLVVNDLGNVTSGVSLLSVGMLINTT